MPATRGRDPTLEQLGRYLGCGTWVERRWEAAPTDLVERQPRRDNERGGARPHSQGLHGSGGETRTHNLRINSLIRPGSLTWENVSNRPLTWPFACSPTCHYLALVFTKSRPRRVLVIKTGESKTGVQTDVRGPWVSKGYQSHAHRTLQAPSVSRCWRGHARCRSGGRMPSNIQSRTRLPEMGCGQAVPVPICSACLPITKGDSTATGGRRWSTQSKWRPVGMTSPRFSGHRCHFRGCQSPPGPWRRHQCCASANHTPSKIGFVYSAGCVTRR